MQKKRALRIETQSPKKGKGKNYKIKCFEYKHQEC